MFVSLSLGAGITLALSALPQKPVTAFDDETLFFALPPEEIGAFAEAARPLCEAARAGMAVSQTFALDRLSAQIRLCRFALLAAGTLVPHAAADALLPEETQAVVGSIVPEDRYPMTFRSDHSETDLTHDFYYTDAFFENTALKYDHRLALATLGLVAACGNTYRSDDLYWLEGEAGREDHIAAAYRELGFANPVCVGYQSSLNTPADRAGCAFAQKTLVQQGRRTTIIVAMLRGVGYGAEWVSNLHLGENSWHYGFVTAAEQFFADLQDYLACAKAAAGELGTIKLWLGGYSRGAAVANLAAARVRRELPQIAQEDTYVYTFAAPAALTAADLPELQADYDNNHTASGQLKADWAGSNIFNLISSGDVVARVMPEEWGYHRNGNDRFLPATTYRNELDDLNIIESRMGGVPLRFDQLATREDVDSVIAAALRFCKSRENYHQKYEAAFMDMIQCAFTRSEEEVADGVILDDEAVMARLRSMPNIRQMDWSRVLRCVMTASAMSRPILERVGAIIPLQARQIVIPVLAVGLCYEVETDVLKLLVYYIISLMSVNSPADSVLRAAFCHYPENYITLMEYYDPAEHGMAGYTRR